MSVDLGTGKGPPGFLFFIGVTGAEVDVMILGTNAKPRQPTKQQVSLQDGVVTDIVLTPELGLNAKP